MLKETACPLSAQLDKATLAEPFAHLGLRTDQQGEGLVLTVWAPGAHLIEAENLDNNRLAGELEPIDERGLFELKLPRRKTPFNYKLLIHYSEQGDDRVVEMFDPYQFTEQAYHAVHYLDTKAENVYNQLGAQLIKLDVAGKQVVATRFAVYAPCLLYTSPSPRDA